MSIPDSLKSSDRLRVPCRRCGKHWWPVPVQVGHHRSSCPVCGKSTEVTVKQEQDRLRVWTRDLP